MEKKARILRIERLSPNDGRGLRTVVFFKGCPLHCAWCSTPESQCGLPELFYKKEKCVSCGKCISVCPNGALHFNEETKKVNIDRNKCKKCFACTKVCLKNAIGVYGETMTVNQVMKQILKDEVFYFHSQGGITLSGGDVLGQAEFAREVLKKCKESGIHTMAELDMYGTYKNIEMLLPYLDAFYVDIKLMDPVMHKKYTGVDNRTILENIRKASAHKKGALHVRIPLIWNVNDSRENIQDTAEFCKSLDSCAELEFLPYHRLGQITYEYLGRDYAFTNDPPMTYEQAYEKTGFLKEMKLPFPVKISGKEIGGETDGLNK